MGQGRGEEGQRGGAGKTGEKEVRQRMGEERQRGDRKTQTKGIGKVGRNDE